VTGGALEVRPVRSVEEREAFIRLPWRIYEGDPCWVPPLLLDIRTMLDRDAHPFHHHSEVELYLALRDGVPVGRVAAVHNRRHVEHHGEPVGFFGFFETEEDPAIAGALLEAAGGWLRDRGLEVMRGPASFSTNEEAGMLVEGFDRPPTIMMPYNPPYYPELLEEMGFRAAKNLVSYWKEENDPPDYLLRAEKVVRRRYPELSVRSLRMDDFQEEVRRIREVYNEAWGENWGFVPMTEEEFRHLAKDLKPVVEPELVLVVEDGDGRPVGFALALPDLNRAMRHANGRLLPFGLLKILWHKRKIATLRVLTLGLVDRYRGKGIDALLYLEIFRRGASLGIQSGEFGWILEDNAAMRRPMERIGARVSKRYRFYDRHL